MHLAAGKISYRRRRSAHNTSFAAEQYAVDRRFSEHKPKNIFDIGEFRLIYDVCRITSFNK